MQMPWLWPAIAILAILTNPAAAGDRKATLDILRAAISDPDDDGALNKFLATLPKVENPLAKGTDFYLIEGDIPMTEKQVRAYLRSQSNAPKAAGDKAPELLVNVEGGKETYWVTPQSRTLKYAVMRASFPDKAKYDKAVTDLAAAAGDWVKACPECGIKFTHVVDLDKSDDPLAYIPSLANDDIRFVVIYSDVTAADPENSYIARAFFPSTPAHLRSVIIDSTYYDQNGGESVFTGRGVLRHELGHVLGYRHEHIREESGCVSEGGSWKPLTPYDGNSVMHYNCGVAMGRGDLVLTAIDKAGHKKLYSRKK